MELDYILYDDSALEFASFIADEVNRLRLEADQFEQEYFKENWGDMDLTSDNE